MKSTNESYRAEAALRQMAAISDSCGDATIVQNLHSIIIGWSRGAKETFGYTAGEIVGRSVSVLIPPERECEVEEMMELIERGEHIENRDTVRLTSEGHVLDVCISVTPIRDESGQVAGSLSIIQNMTSRRETANTLREIETRRQKRALILETSRLVTLEILPTRSGVEALRQITDAARDLTGARYAALGVVADDGTSFSNLVTAGFTPTEQVTFETTSPSALAEADGVLRLLSKREEPLRLQVSPESGGETFLGVPLRRGEICLGALYLTNKAGGEAFTEDDEINLLALGVHATVAIHNLHALERERALVKGLLVAHEEERRAIAFDLHDGLTQNVMGAHIHLEAFESAKHNGNELKAARELAETSRQLQEAVKESRRVINGLRMLALEDLGLEAALELLIADEKEHAGWPRTEFQSNLGSLRLDRMLETAVYRITQEALTNARKHAKTTWVKVICERKIDVDSKQEALHLQVSDGGLGFAVSSRLQSSAKREGIGLQSMAERTRLLFGCYDLRSAPGEGTTIEATFPIAEPVEKTPNEN